MTTKRRREKKTVTKKQQKKKSTEKKAEITHVSEIFVIYAALILNEHSLTMSEKQFEIIHLWKKLGSFEALASAWRYARWAHTEKLNV